MLVFLLALHPVRVIVVCTVCFDFAAVAYRVAVPHCVTTGIFTLAESPPRAFTRTTVGKNDSTRGCTEFGTAITSV